MSYEDDDGWDDPERDGPLTVVASFLYVHEAELARSKLEAEGFRAVVWDAGVVSADPLLALAVHGVKVMVRQRFALRAAAVLRLAAGGLAEATRPVFRVRRARARTALLVSAALGLGFGVGLMRACDEPLMLLVGLALGLALHALLAAPKNDSCSGCAAPLPEQDVAACPRCGKLMRGTIAHRDERLAAEERCEDESERDPRD